MNDLVPLIAAHLARSVDPALRERRSTHWHSYPESWSALWGPLEQEDPDAPDAMRAACVAMGALLRACGVADARVRDACWALLLARRQEILAAHSVPKIVHDPVGAVRRVCPEMSARSVLEAMWRTPLLDERVLLVAHAGRRDPTAVAESIRRWPTLAFDTVQFSPYFGYWAKWPSCDGLLCLLHAEAEAEGSLSHETGIYRGANMAPVEIASFFDVALLPPSTRD